VYQIYITSNLRPTSATLTPPLFACLPDAWHDILAWEYYIPQPLVICLGAPIIEPTERRLTANSRPSGMQSKSAGSRRTEDRTTGSMPANASYHSPGAHMRVLTPRYVKDNSNASAATERAKSMSVEAEWANVVVPDFHAHPTVAIGWQVKDGSNTSAARTKRAKISFVQQCHAFSCTCVQPPLCIICPLTPHAFQAVLSLRQGDPRRVRLGVRDGVPCRLLHLPSAPTSRL
jgi:hypothetical protein